MVSGDAKFLIKIEKIDFDYNSDNILRSGFYKNLKENTKYSFTI